MEIITLECTIASKGYSLGSSLRWLFGRKKALRLIVINIILKTSSCWQYISVTIAGL